MEPTLGHDGVKTSIDEAVARVRGGAALYYHTMGNTVSVYSTLHIVNLLNCSFHLGREGGLLPWLAMLI